LLPIARESSSFSPFPTVSPSFENLWRDNKIILPASRLMPARPSPLSFHRRYVSFPSFCRGTFPSVLQVRFIRSVFPCDEQNPTVLLATRAGPLPFLLFSFFPFDRSFLLKKDTFPRPKFENLSPLSPKTFHPFPKEKRYLRHLLPLSRDECMALTTSFVCQRENPLAPFSFSNSPLPLPFRKRRRSPPLPRLRTEGLMPPFRARKSPPPQRTSNCEDHFSLPPFDSFGGCLVKNVGFDGLSSDSPPPLILIIISVC